MFEVVVGIMMLLLGWLCFRQLSRVSRAERPLLTLRATLGLLLILSGAALLALTLPCEV